MTLLRGFVVLLLVTSLQAALGRLWPSAHAYIDLTLLPVIWYGIRSGQRSGMVVGCAAGLLQDAWFQAGVFGLNGFKKTLLGWALGSVNTRLDLGHTPGRFGAAVCVVLGDGLLNVVLARLLDQSMQPRGLGILLLQALLTGLLAALIGSMVDRSEEKGPRMGAATWRGTA